jgi:CDGSH-type Zn-finger protein
VSADGEHGAGHAGDAGEVGCAGGREARRVVMPGQIGPLLVSGPVEVVLPDGSTRSSGRPVVALCVCGRSGCYPFCDTSHRRRSRPRRRALVDGEQQPGAVGQRDAQ